MINMIFKSCLLNVFRNKFLNVGHFALFFTVTNKAELNLV